MATLLGEYPEWFLSRASEALADNTIGTTTTLNIPTIQDTTPETAREGFYNGVNRSVIFKTDINGIEPIWNDVTWLKFLKSIPFVFAEGSRALDSNDPNYYQNQGLANEAIRSGLVTLATDIEVRARDNGTIAEYSRVVRPSQLPEVEAVDNNLILPSNNFNINLIPGTPNRWIFEEINLGIATHNRHDISITDAAITWFRDSFNAIKQYIDTVDVRPYPVDSVLVQGVIGAFNGQINVNTIPADADSTDNFELQVQLTIDDDGLLAADSSDRIASQRAIKEYIDAVAALITGLATQADLLNLISRVDIMQGGAGATLKANQLDLLLLEALVNTKLSRTTDDTALGIITFTQVPVIQQDPTIGDHAVRLSYLDTRLLDYLLLDGSNSPMTGPLQLHGNYLLGNEAIDKDYADLHLKLAGGTMSGFITLHALPNANFHAVPKIYVDDLIANLQAQIDALDTRVQAIEDLLALGITGTYRLERLSSIVLNSGIVTNIVT